MSCKISAPRHENGHTYVDITTSGCLFDLDGTLMMSTPCVEAFWRDFGKEYGIDAEELLKTSHGRRTIDLFELVKPEFATKKHSSDFEATIPKKYGHLSVIIPGVADFLQSLPTDRWGIVTSGCRVMAETWLTEYLGVKFPGVFITAEDIDVGKPDPQGYLKGKKALDLASDFVVFEDAHAGVKAGVDAGATVIGMATTYDAKTVKGFGASIVIPDMTHIKLTSYDATTKTLVLTITDPVA
ncbi:glycerol-1-phosphatase [Starmerella bacillaris]|uniref:Glycerol-1-phosphatase n=1 Tax=Starmerella bacillaris TaxID=1247836 RepID=A0AAV5RIG8_STABA|nr:glycerol-1-phosphatase [Starmerella bacillaris]